MIRNKNARIDECNNLLPRNCCVFGIGNQSSSTFSCICFPLFCLCLCEELLDRMASREVLNFVQGCKLNETLLKKLKIALQTINAVLKDAEVKQITNPEVKEWADELKDAVYHAEDLLDQIATKASRYKMNADIRISAIQVRSTNSASLSPFGEGVESKVEEIIDRLELLAQQKEALGLKKGIGEKLPKRWPSTSLVDESGVYGRGADKEEIIKFLLSHCRNGNKICVISIVGAGCVGKTTLAQLVYNDKRVKQHFDLQAWVCVSDEFDPFRVVKQILEATNSGSCESCDLNRLNLLQVKLKKILDRKKFLLVLDDVWNEKYNNWDLLRTSLEFGLGGSKIIVTMRNRRVALIMPAAHTHHLPQLSFEDCWSLFARHAFDNGDSSPYPKLEEIGKEIVKKCNGLPLAAKTLGGLLYSNVKADKWDNVLKSEMWGFPGEEILPALRLSYYYLPSHLKRCFAYCSIFPKGYEFQKESLILLWMAEGLLHQPKGNKKRQELDDMEELCDQYFEELLSRSLFEKSRSSKSCFVMHDFINDLAQLISGEFCIRLESGEADEILEKARHLSYFRSECDALERFETLVEVKCLRSFLSLQMPAFVSVSYLSNRVLHDLLPTLRCLRALSLCGYQMFVLFDSIGNLQHLRYLNLSSTRIKGYLNQYVVYSIYKH